MNGFVQRCGQFPRETAVGNVYEKRLREIFAANWEGLTFHDLMARVKGKCASCENNDLCRGCRAAALYYLGDVEAADPKCWFNPEAKETYCNNLNNLYDCPEFVLDAPYFYDEGGMEYYKGEFQRLIGFLEGHTHRKLDYERLEEILVLSKQATDAYIEISELRKAAPTPMHGRDGIRNYGLFYEGIGTEEMVLYLETIRDELREKVNRGIGAIEDERYRICWLYVTPGPWLRLFDWLEREYRAVIAMETFTYMVNQEIDPQKPIESIARKAMHYPVVRQYHGPVDNIVNDHLQMLREYKADAAIAVAPPGCKQFCAALRILRDATKKETATPFLIIDADGLDPSSMSEGEFQARFEEFFERLEEMRR